MREREKHNKSSAQSPYITTPATASYVNNQDNGKNTSADNATAHVIDSASRRRSSARRPSVTGARRRSSANQQSATGNGSHGGDGGSDSTDTTNRRERLETSITSDDGHECPVSPTQARAAIRGLISPLMSDGLVGHLGSDACLFAWDQAVIGGFGVMLPRIAAMVVVAAREKLEACGTFSMMMEALLSHTHLVSVRMGITISLPAGSYIPINRFDFL